MTAIAANRFTAPQPLLSVPSRIVAAVAVVAVIALASIGAGQASHHAVDTAAQTFSKGVTHIQLSPVQIVGRRDAAAARRT